MNPIVSVIVTTKNSESFLENCLRSVKAQTYEPVELLLVDNFSTDRTMEIARRYADRVIVAGPERSPQRNLGVKNATGEFVVIIDSDMELAPDLLAECVRLLRTDPLAVAVIIPEESFGEGFWARCKRLERSFYQGVSWMEAARFFRKSAYQEAGGYDETMVSGEDWDLSQRVERVGKLLRSQACILHNEGRINLWRTIKKKYYYAGHFATYTSENRHQNVRQQTGLLARYRLFFACPRRLFADPFLGLGMLLMKTLEFGFGGLGYLKAKWRQKTMFLFDI